MYEKNDLLAEQFEATRAECLRRLRQPGADRDALAADLVAMLFEQLGLAHARIAVLRDDLGLPPDDLEPVDDPSWLAGHGGNP